MKWQIPAKTFLLGEYVALTGAGAIILTTLPCFEISIIQNNSNLIGINKGSPAANWWHKHRLPQGLACYDPYAAQGGLGASSAQFLGAYFAAHFLWETQPTHDDLLNAYYTSAWSGKGMKPSGYDVIAQTQYNCVYINRSKGRVDVFDWVFNDIAFILLHSGHKLATHYHLENLILPSEIKELALLSDQANFAFERNDSTALIEAINGYQQQLTRLNLISPQTFNTVERFSKHPEVLAIKGCGALGADVFLLIVHKSTLEKQVNSLHKEGWNILATSNALCTSPSLMS